MARCLPFLVLLAEVLYLSRVRGVFGGGSLRFWPSSHEDHWVDVDHRFWSTRNSVYRKQPVAVGGRDLRVEG
jgi:hypothetical protein